ncbi:MAG: hypothetical protein ACRD3G_19475 [Vicinamibacterales bacterium]
MASEWHRRQQRERELRLINKQNRTRAKLSELNARIRQAERAERQDARVEVLDEVVAAKAEAMSAIDACPFPEGSPYKREWQRELTGILLTSDHGEARLKNLRDRVRACRADCDLSRVGGFATAMYGEQEAATRRRLNWRLEIVEMRLDKLIRLAWFARR